MATPTLTHIFTLRAYMAKKSLEVGAVKAGPRRFCCPLVGGFLKGEPGSRGEGCNFDLVPGGSDWLLFEPTISTSFLDVRTHGHNADGDSVFIHYTGYLRVDEAGEKVMNWAPDAKTTVAGDHHWWSGPIFETSSQNFKWIETTLFVGQGCWIVEEDGQQAVQYKIFAVNG